MKDQARDKNINLLTIIVAEILVTPLGLGGASYLVLKNSNNRVLYTAFAALFGLGLAMYRIFLISKSTNHSKNGKK